MGRVWRPRQGQSILYQRHLVHRQGRRSLARFPDRFRKWNTVCCRFNRYDKVLDRVRNLVECRVEKLKQFRRVATRYEKRSRNFLGVVTFAAIPI